MTPDTRQTIPGGARKEDPSGTNAAARRLGLTLVALALALPLAALPGCGGGPTPVRESRDALGTIVTVTTYPVEGDASAARAAIGRAYEAMADVERQLDAQSATSAVGVFNRDPYSPRPLPSDASLVMSAVERLGVGDRFSPALLGVLRLYDFEGGGRVPDEAGLRSEVNAARSFGVHVRVETLPTTLLPEWSFAGPPLPMGLPAPGLDFGGATKGLALDRAVDVMRGAASPAALLSAGSTTIAYGAKPGGEPWRVGVENPRDTEKLVATVTAERDLVLSTSGDYQRFFERNGIRYHHIIDPRTGKPARGLRSLTVLGKMSALDSDILSTALFVAGRRQAEAYAREHGLGLITVDDTGVARAVQPKASGVRIELSDR